MTKLTRVVIVPGNGCWDIRNSNWYGWLYDTLLNQIQDGKTSLKEVICENMPDPDRARAIHWLPYMKDILKIDQDTIAVGHSSGAEALMRYAELYPIGAVILVSACWSDLGIKSERLSGYYPNSDGTNPWRFDIMRQNCVLWHQFHSDDDPFIPIDEAERVKDGLDLIPGINYHFLPDRSHFFDYPFPELISLIDVILETNNDD